MSHDATNWAIKQRGLKPATKILLWYLADCHNPSMGCFPSQEFLIEQSEMSERSVRNHLEELERIGLISKTLVRDHGKRWAHTEYKLFFDVFHEPPAKSAGGLSTGKSGLEPPANPSMSHRQNLPTNLVNKPVNKPVNKQERASAHVDDFYFYISMQEEQKPTPKNGDGATAVPETRTPVEIEFDLFMKASPRELNESAKEAEFQKSWPAFERASKLVDAQILTKAIKAYAKSCTRSNKENKYIKYPSTWLDDKRWRDFPCAKSPSAKSADQATKLKFYADILNGNEPIHPSLISSSLADELYESGQVTAERLRERLPA